MRFPWSPRRNPPFVRNRPILRSPVMARWDALFADRSANEAIYSSILADSAAPLTAEYLREVFARHSPDSEVQGVSASSEDVIAHVFEHILGPDSWWGKDAAEWQGEALVTAAYRDAIERAQALGNVPICTFHLQASADDGFGLQVLETPHAIIVLIATPPIPWGPTFGKLVALHDESFSPVDLRMPEVSSYTIETMPG